MKRLALAVALALVWATGASAQTQVSNDVQHNRRLPATAIGGILTADSTGAIARFDASDRLIVADGDRDRDANINFQQLYSDTLSIVTRALDSLATPIDVHDCASVRFILLPEGVVGGVGDEIRLGVTLFGHFTSSPDSTNTWARQWTSLSVAAYGAADTSIGHPVTAAAGTPYASERVVLLRGVGWRTGTAGSHATGGAGHQFIELRADGWIAPWASLKFRVLSTTVGTQTNSALHKFRLRVHAVCSPL